MHACHYCVSNSNLSIKLNFILTNLSVINATVNVSTTCISTANLSTTVTSHVLTTATNNLSNSNTAIKLSSDDIRKFQIKNHPKLEIIHLISCQDHASRVQELKDALSNNLEINQKSLTSNIPPATVIENESLTAIFPFKIEELSKTSLFSGATLKEKLIMAIYTNTKIDAANARIITANRATKTPIGKINNLSIKVNIIVLIKVLVIEATQYQNSRHTCVPATCGHFKSIIMPSAPLIEFEEE
ncbi:hypothetical protein G9A89_015512 [Geosiphon pyriformis]|nr:hypothetical protein G9A89_015512 [Geosiphon pyriformis]